MEILCNKKIYKEELYKLEDDFEKEIVNNVNEIFGSNGIYFNIKKRIKIY